MMLEVWKELLPYPISYSGGMLHAFKDVIEHGYNLLF